MNIPYGLKTMAVLAFVGGAWLGTPSAEPAQPASSGKWYLAIFGARTCEDGSGQLREFQSPLNTEQWARGAATFLKTEIVSRDGSNRPDVVAVRMRDPSTTRDTVIMYFRNPYLCREVVKVNGSAADLR